MRFVTDAANSIPKGWYYSEWTVKFSELGLLHLSDADIKSAGRYDLTVQLLPPSPQTVVCVLSSHLV